MQKGYSRGIKKLGFAYLFFLGIFEGLALFFPILLQRVTEIISRGAEDPNTDGIMGEIFISAALVFGFIILMMIINFVAEFFVAAYTNKYAENIRARLFNKFQRLSPNQIEEYGQSKVMPVVLNDPIWMRNYRRRQLQAIIFIPVTIFGSIAMMFSLNVTYSLIALGAIPFVAVFFLWWYRRMSRVIPKSVDAFDGYFLNIKEGISGARDIRILGKAEERSREFSKLVTLQRRQAMNIDFSTNLSASFNGLIFTAITIIIILYGIHVNMETARELVILNTILQYLIRLQAGSHNLFIWFVEIMPRAKVCRIRMKELFDMPEEGEAVGTSVPAMAEPSLVFSRVGYTYPNGKRGLADINMQIPYKSRIAIAGGIGSGKSVLPKLLLRDKVATEGQVLLNGIDLASIYPKDLRRQVFSYCGPTALFERGTVRDNMRILSPDVTDKEILKVFKDLGADDFVKKFNGNLLDFELSERATLGDGAKNLFNIVRTLLKPAMFYVFNQCFEHVRSDYIKNLMQKMEREERTALFISYDSTVCKACDNVYVLRNGRINGEGTHVYLLRNNPDYQKFYASSGGMILTEVTETEIRQAEELKTEMDGLPTEQLSHIADNLREGIGGATAVGVPT